MPVRWFQSQQAAEAPIAPLSSQQTAARWEPSVQGLVTEIGGYTIAELQQFTQHRWRHKYEIDKVWRATDAIGDRGLHSYLQHHWVIIRLVPAETQSYASQNHGSSIESLRNGNSAVSSNSERLAVLPAYTTAQPAAPEPPQLQPTTERTPDVATHEATEAGPSEAKRQKLETEESQPTTSVDQQSAEIFVEASQGDAASTASQEIDAGSNEGPSMRLTTEASLDAEQSQNLQPIRDCGMKLADDGHAWFLRIDRFNEADKWFACGSFENAMQSEQARMRHFSPESEVAYEYKEGTRLPLECILQSLVRLALVKYSVFAKGNHCQWHARVLITLIASLCHFVNPSNGNAVESGKVTPILLDGKEQQRYSAMAGKFGGPDNAYLRSFPEAPYLKDAILDLKSYAKQAGNRSLHHVPTKAFPDLQLVYASISS